MGDVDLQVERREPECDDPTVVIYYDGSDLAGGAILRAADELGPGREAVVVCVWQPGNVGFIPVGATKLRATAACDVRREAEYTAAHGASLATAAGFHARSLTVQAAPTWQGVVAAAQMYGARTIVMGSRHRDGRFGRLLGSVAAATAAHFEHEVLVVRRDQLRGG